MNDDPEITRLRNLLSVLDLKKRDLIKKQKELKNAKIILDNYISKKNSFNNNPTGYVVDPITLQQTNIDILDAFNEVLISKQSYELILKNVNHLTNIISHIDIESSVDNVLATATSSYFLI